MTEDITPEEPKAATQEDYEAHSGMPETLYSLLGLCYLAHGYAPPVNERFKALEAKVRARKPAKRGAEKIPEEVLELYKAICKDAKIKDAKIKTRRLPESCHLEDLEFTETKKNTGYVAITLGDFLLACKERQPCQNDDFLNRLECGMKQRTEHEKRCMEDPLYRLNEFILKGSKDVQPLFFHSPTWGVAEACAVIQGCIPDTIYTFSSQCASLERDAYRYIMEGDRSEQYEALYSPYVVPSIEPYFYNLILDAVKQGEISLNNDGGNAAEVWKMVLRIKSVLQWCKKKGVYMRPQLLKLIGEKAGDGAEEYAKDAQPEEQGQEVGGNYYWQLATKSSEEKKALLPQHTSRKTGPTKKAVYASMEKKSMLPPPPPGSKKQGDALSCEQFEAFLAHKGKDEFVPEAKYLHSHADSTQNIGFSA